jgi:hypothetical protein
MKPCQNVRALQVRDLICSHAPAGRLTLSMTVAGLPDNFSRAHKMIPRLQRIDASQAAVASRHA